MKIVWKHTANPDTIITKLDDTRVGYNRTIIKILRFWINKFSINLTPEISTS